MFPFSATTILWYYEPLLAWTQYKSSQYSIFCIHRISINNSQTNHGQLPRWCKWRACDIGQAKEGLENELWHRWSNRRVGEWAVSIHLCHSSFSNPSVASPMSQLIPQPFRCFTYVTAHSLTLPLLHLRHSSFSNPSVTLPMSQLILQPFCCFTYFTGSSLTSPGKLPMIVM